MKTLISVTTSRRCTVKENNMSEDKELQKLNTIENTEIDADDDDIEDAEDTDRKSVV